MPFPMLFRCITAFLCCFLLSVDLIRAQDELIGDKQGRAIRLNVSETGKVYRAHVEGEDTLAELYLPAVMIIGDYKFKNASEEKKYKKLVRDVKKVYPYAQVAAKKMNEYNGMLSGKTERERKALMKQAESEIKAEFMDDIENMTLSQGRILLKLIDRETGNNSYALIKEFRGGFSAFFWQSLGRIFDVNLKTEYNPEGEDQQIESIVQLIKAGKI